MGFGEAIKTVYGKYADFNGRAGRAEYWWWFLYYILGLAACALVGQAIGAEDLLTGLFALANLLPNLAVGARRLHDRGMTAWLLLIMLIPVIGGLILLIFFALEGEAGANRFGPDPRGAAADPAP
ncbi:MAG: DUF805 domain-containing protein [Oceanicaulis sp.]